MSFDTALRTVLAEHQAARPCPQAGQPDGELSDEDRALWLEYVETCRTRTLPTPTLEGAV